MSRDTSPRPDPTSRRQLRALFRARGFRPRRRLGQTFLTDANIVRKIVALADLHAEAPVLEIGAGAGAVTRELAPRARRLVAVEIAPTLLAILEETVGDRAEIVQADVLELDWAALLGAEPRGSWTVVANLPYAITGPAILKLMDARQWLDRLVVMVQQEVADRLVAEPGLRARGMLTVIVEAICETKLAARVSRTCFWPEPRVDSAVIALTVRRPALVPQQLEPAFREVVKAAFGTRRKMLLNALGGAAKLGLTKQEAKNALSNCGIEPRRRAESLSAEECVRHAAALPPHAQKDEQ